MIEVMMFDKSFACPDGKNVAAIIECGPWLSRSTWSGTIWHLLMAGF